MDDTASTTQIWIKHLGILPNPSTRTGSLLEHLGVLTQKVIQLRHLRKAIILAWLVSLLANKFVESFVEIFELHVLTSHGNSSPVKDEFRIGEWQLEGFLDRILEILERNLLIIIIVNNVEGLFQIEFLDLDRVSNFLRHLKLPVLGHLNILNPVLERFPIILPINFDVNRAHLFILVVRDWEFLVDQLVMAQGIEVDLSSTDEVRWHRVIIIMVGLDRHDGNIVIEYLEF